MNFASILYVHERPGAEWALERALDLAGRIGARLTIAACVEEVSPDLLGASEMDPARLEALAAEDRQQELEELEVAQRAKAGGASIKVVRGRPFVATIREVARGGHDLVVVAAPERGGILGKLGLSSTAMHLVRKSPVPVWVVRTSPRSPARIGVAVSVANEEQRLDRSLVEAGAALARAFSATVRVFHVLFLHPSEAVLRERAGVGEAEIASIVTRARSRAERGLQELVSNLGVPAALRVLEGSPILEISSYVERERLDVLVMGTLGRSGIAGLLIGNTAEEIIQRVACSVLALKPPGFVTPVV